MCSHDKTRGPQEALSIHQHQTSPSVAAALLSPAFPLIVPSSNSGYVFYYFPNSYENLHSLTPFTLLLGTSKDQALPYEFFCTHLSLIKSAVQSAVWRNEQNN